MAQLLFPNSMAVRHQDFEIEVVPEGCRKYPRLLASLQEQVLHVANRSRGWDAQNIDHMRAHFKLGPLYEVNSLALIRKNGTLLGLAGTVNDWQVNGNCLIHLCSVGLLPEAQRRGFIPVFMVIVFLITLRDPQAAEAFLENRLFVTAITQSPYLYAMLHKLFTVYPSPQRAVIPQEVQAIARAVVDRFDPSLRMEDSLTIRGECNFFYQKVPYSYDRRLNAFCDARLDYNRGDVFVVVGQVEAERLQRHIASVIDAHPELFSEFRTCLQGSGDEVFDNLCECVRETVDATGPV